MPRSRAPPRCKAAIPALATLAGGIGDPQVRNRGTIGGSIANNDPAADYPAAVLGLGATIVTDRARSRPTISSTAMFETALDAGEIITAVRFPIPDAAGYAKFQSQASRFALVGVFVAQNRRTACASRSPARRRWCFAASDIEDALGGGLLADRRWRGYRLRRRGSTRTSMPTASIARIWSG